MRYLNISAASALAAIALLAQAQSAPPARAADIALDPGQHIACVAPDEPARVDELRSLADGKLAFRISTFSQTYAGIADPSDPKYSMEKQVVALQGQTYFCLRD